MYKRIITSTLMVILSACGHNEDRGFKEGGFPAILIQPGPLVFTSTTIGDENTKILSITNTSDGVLRIQRIDFREGDEDPPGELSKVSKWPDQAVIGQLESISLAIKWTPVNDTPDTAMITIDSNDPQSPTVEFPIRTTKPGRAF